MTNKFNISNTEWGQISIVPFENKNDITSTLKEPISTNFHIAWDDIHYRLHPRVPISSLEISFDKLCKSLPIDTKDFGIPICNHKNSTEVLKNGFTFCISDFLILYGKTENNIVTDLNIEFANYKPKVFKNEIKFLNRFANIYNIIIIDWVHEFIIDPKKTDELEHYFNKIISIYSEE